MEFLDKLKIIALESKTVGARVARFFLVHYTKTGKYIPNHQKVYQITKKYTKSPKSIPNGRKISPIAIKYANIFHCKTIINLPKL
jgi:hypothetical protein